MTFKALQDAVLFNSFGERYRSLVQGYLNAGVVDVCRRLQLTPTQQIVTYDSQGLVDPTLRLHRVDDVWTAEGAATTNPQLFAANARTQLTQLPMDVSGAAAWQASDPYAFTAEQVPDTAGMIVRVRVWPVSAAGLVAISGLVLPTAMSADTDVSGLGTEADSALVAFGRMRAFQSEDDMQMAAAWAQEYERAVRSIGLGKQVTRGPVITPGDSHLL